MSRSKRLQLQTTTARYIETLPYNGRGSASKMLILGQFELKHYRVITSSNMVVLMKNFMLNR